MARRQTDTSSPSGAALRAVCSCHTASGVLGVSVAKKSKMTAANDMPLFLFSTGRRSPARALIVAPQNLRFPLYGD